MSKQISQKFRKLDDIEHCLLRPGRYIGSIAPHTSQAWSYDEANKTMVRQELTWCPALLKVFDEVISNSVDFSKTVDGSHVTFIKVNVDRETGMISVMDDGGIPVVKHPEHDQWIPELIYELKAGSNFNDEEEGADNQFGTGQNGEGAALTAIFSKEFYVTTADGKNQLYQIRSNNSRSKTDPKIKPSNKHFTTIEWLPDYEKFGLKNLDLDNYAMLVKRTVDIAGCNPKLKVFLNGERITIKDFNDYVGMFQEEFIYDSNEYWKVALAHAEEGFEHISFVNGTMTKLGGPHVDYIVNQLCIKLREFFNKKHKIDVKPSELRPHFRLFIDAQIVRPRYDSQTKDNLITEVRNFGTTFDISDKFIKQVLKSPIIQSVLDWVEAKAKADELAQLRKLNKDVGKSDPKKVEKFSDANERVQRHLCECYLSEGDCIEENTKVRCIQNGELKDTSIGNLKCGDLVLTHQNKFETVTQITYSVKNVMKLKTSIGEILVSENHRLLVFNKITNQIYWEHIKNLNTNDFQLVRSTLLDIFHIEIISKELENDIYTLKFEIEPGISDDIISSPTHNFYVFDINDLTYKMINAKELNKDFHFLTFRYKYNINNGRIENENQNTQL